MEKKSSRVCVTGGVELVMEKKSSRVCVTGGAGYIGSWLVKKLLDRGHYVHTTLRNLGDQSKTGLLKSLPGAEARLSLFQADIYNPEEFDPAIQGCEFVFLVATPYQHNPQSSKGYTLSKTLSEREILGYNYTDDQKRKVEVVSLVCGLVGGDTLLSYVPVSVQCVVSPLTGEEKCHRQLKFLQALLGSIPLVHIEDVCEAHVFCMEKPSMAGRFICTNVNPTIKEFIDHYKQKYPEHGVIKEVEGIEKRVDCCSTKLVDLGFKYVYDAKQILEDSVECAKRLGGLNKVIVS